MSKGERTREAVLEAALDQASVVGLEGLSIGTLATRAGLSKSGLFAHFGSKEALQVETLKAATQRFAAAVILPARKEPPGLGRLRAQFRNWLDWTEQGGIRGGCIFLAAAIELDDRAGPVRDFVVESQKVWLKTLAKSAARASRNGELEAGLDAEDFAHAVHGIYLAYHQSHRLLRDRGSKPRALRALESLILSHR